MRLRVKLALFALISLRSALGADCTWSSEVPYPISIQDNGMAAVGKTLYSFGGVSANLRVTNAYKLEGTDWEAIAPLPVALEKPAVVSDGTYLYIINGAINGGNTVNTLYRYEPDTDSYTTLAPSGIAAFACAAVFVDGKIYKTTGTRYTGGVPTFLNATEVYNVASNTWTAAANYPLSVNFASAFARDGFVYVAGGFIAGEGPTAKTYRYDPIFNVWSDKAMADLPQPRWGAADASYNDGCVLAGGGTSSSALVQSVVFWNPASDAWSNLPDMIEARVRCTGAVRSDGFHPVGGTHGAFSDSFGHEKLLCLPAAEFATDGSAVVFAGDNGTLDPDEFVTVTLRVRNIGSPGICTTALTGTLQETGGVTEPNPPTRDYGAVCGSGPVVARTFSFKVSPALSCGDPVTVSLALDDGGTSYGILTYNLVTGAPGLALTENFDGVTAPNLPPGWIAANAIGPAPLWVTSSTTPDSPPNAAFVDNPPVSSDKRLDTPTISIASASAELRFRNSYDTEPNWDGGVLEVSSPNINGGAFTDILDPVVGGSFVSGGYNTTLNSSSNPLADRQAWSGFSNGYIMTVVKLGPNVAGQSIKLRFRMGSDSSESYPGWRIDNVAVKELSCDPPFIVTTTGNYDDGACTESDCTLREAINAANAQVGGQTILFAPGITGAISTTTSSGGLPITDSVTINGPGARLLALTGASVQRVLNNSAPDVIVRGLTIRNGNTTTGNGAGIHNTGGLTLEDCTVLNNIASATSGAGGLGGGVYNQGAATLVMTGCTLQNNSAGQFGGGVFNDGTFSATNCTFTGNTALRGGGLISRFNGGASSSTLRNCTITNNTATSTGAGIGDGGGGYFAEGGIDQHRLGNCIIAGNTNSVNPDLRGQVLSDGHSLLGSRGSSTLGIADGRIGDLAGTNAAPLDAQFDSLGNHGGPTDTWSLLGSSPAIDAGSDALALSTDQRGYVRAGVSDMGAFEFDGVPPAVQLLSVASRKVHGSAGAFDINMLLVSPSGIESRTGGAGGDHVLIFTFANTLMSVGGASVTSGVGSVSSRAIGADAHEYVVNLTGVANAQEVTVTLTNVTDTLGNSSPSVLITMGVLVGDTTASRIVNASDIGQTKGQSGLPATASNFRTDVNVNGTVNAADVGLVKSAAGTSLPP